MKLLLATLAFLFLGVRASAQTLPAGCVSFTGYSPTTGMKCVSDPVEHWIDFGSPARLPVEGTVLQAPGIVKLELREDILFLDGKAINLFVSRLQEGRKTIDGRNLYEELEKLGGNVSSRVLDYLVDHPHLWPNQWKTGDGGKSPLCVFFWGEIFRFHAPQDPSADSSGDLLFVKYGSWQDGKVVSNYFRLHYKWWRNFPAASFLS